MFPFASAVLQPTLPSNLPLPPAATGGWVYDLVTVTKLTARVDDCAYIASCAPRFNEICDVIYWHLLAAAASE